MATYKVIQDIEAEDKLLGPLTLRQFVYASIVIVLGFISFKLAAASWLLIIPLLPPMVFFSVLAAPFGHDQSNEVWLLAKIRFFLKPRRRIWDQSGLKELVTITVPKRIEKHLTNGLNQEEVHSRLNALANTIDSRGWAVKNVNINLFSQPSYVSNQPYSDRLVDPSTMPQEVPNYDASSFNDIMDEQHNATAQHLQQLVVASAQSHRLKAVEQMHQATNGDKQQATSSSATDYWFLNQPDPASIPAGYQTFSATPPIIPGISPQFNTSDNEPTADESALLARIRSEQSKPVSSYHHLKTIQPLGTDQPVKHMAHVTPSPAQPPSGFRNGTSSTDPVILKLAQNDDLNVATIARQAKKTNRQPPNDEVVISLR
ncbi:MAG: hypothetical protein NVS1B7_1730 [Candidatus Saccharimonadales bacterium]